MQPQTQEPSKPPAQSNKKLFIAIGICIAVIITAIIAMIVVLSSPIKKDGANEPNGAAPSGVLTVGSNPYIYACSTMTRDDIAKASGLSGDKTDEAISFDQAIPYDQVTDKQYDLIKTIQDPYGMGAIRSECNFTKSTGETRQQVKLTLNQYSKEDAAKKSFNSKKTYAKTDLAFASFKDTSFISPESKKLNPSDPDRVESSILAKNIIIELTYEMGNATPQDASSKLDPLVKTIVQKINDADATSPHDFTGLGTVGKSKFVDACKATNFSKLSGPLGGLDYERAQVNGKNTYGVYKQDGTTIRSNCGANFRYSEDKNKQPNFNESSSILDTATQYPNNLDIEIVTYADSSAAQAVLAKEKAELPKKTLLKPFDFTYGSTSLGYATEDTFLKMQSSTRTYKAVKGSSVIVFTFRQSKVEKPYQSTVKTPEDSALKTVFDSIKIN